MKTRIFNLIIIDESGSMAIIKNEAINGVNESIQSIRAAQVKHEEQEHYVSVVSFNEEIKEICNCVAANEVKELTNEEYCPNSCTALYDAMGMSLNALRPKVADNDKVVVTIVTDGEENASKEYNDKAIKALVDELKGKGWVFAYIGANQDVEKVATKISITNTLSFHATSVGTASMNKKLATARQRLFNSIAEDNFSSETGNTSFFDFDEED